jgi:LPS O-antigen subunit length determinant protein (WzzB/FepE family)
MDMVQELDNTNLRYREVSAREMEAQISQQLEQEKKGERFTLIDPPQEPLEPYSPNRLLIILLGVVLAGLGGFGSVVLAENMDASIHSENAIAAILGVPPLATIPYLESRKEQIDRVNQRRALFMGTIVTIIAALAIFNFAVMPLDVFWYKLLRIISNL